MTPSQCTTAGGSSSTSGGCSGSNQVIQFLIYLSFLELTFLKKLIYFSAVLIKLLVLLLHLAKFLQDKLELVSKLLHAVQEALLSLAFVPDLTIFNVVWLLLLLLAPKPLIKLVLI